MYGYFDHGRLNGTFLHIMGESFRIITELKSVSKCRDQADNYSFSELFSFHLRAMTILLEIINGL